MLITLEYAIIAAENAEAAPILPQTEIFLLIGV